MPKSFAMPGPTLGSLSRSCPPRLPSAGGPRPRSHLAAPRLPTRPHLPAVFGTLLPRVRSCSLVWPFTSARPCLLSFPPLPESPPPDLPDLVLVLELQEVEVEPLLLPIVSGSDPSSSIASSHPESGHPPQIATQSFYIGDEDADETLPPVPESIRRQQQWV